MGGHEEGIYTFYLIYTAIYGYGGYIWGIYGYGGYIWGMEGI
jgi:hypothetical protein